jgi:hypothetical protein
MSRPGQRGSFDDVGGPAQRPGEALPYPGQLAEPWRILGLARPLGLPLLARVEEGEDPRGILVFFVKRSASWGFTLVMMPPSWVTCHLG